MSDAGSPFTTAILALATCPPSSGCTATGRVPGAFVIVDGSEGGVSTRGERQPSTFCRAGGVRPEPGQPDAPREADSSGAAPLSTADGTGSSSKPTSTCSATRRLPAQGAEGVGLSSAPAAGRAADTVSAHRVYRQLLEMKPAPVTIRTFDIDEDQLATGKQHRRASGLAGA